MDSEQSPTDAGRQAAAASPAVPGPQDDALGRRLREKIEQAGGWMAFDAFMAEALYAPGLGYYSGGRPIFGLDPRGGSDFVTAPELSPFFGRTVAAQVLQGLLASGTAEVIEFGAGTGALAEQLLDALPAALPDGRPLHYAIVDLSGPLRGRQQERLARFGHRVRWLDAWPERIEGVIVGNEVLDAMPVALVSRAADTPAGHWHARGVALAPDGRFAFADRHEALPLADTGRAAEALAAWPAGAEAVTETHTQAEAFIASLAERLVRGLVLLIDYGFPESEYYHPQRAAGTLMCHQAHVADADPLVAVGQKDITAHVNFSGVALAAQDAGLDVLGYTSQARFLINCGLTDVLKTATAAERAMAQKLITEHEMGELFKVIALARDCGDLDPIGFSVGDRSHRL